MAALFARTLGRKYTGLVLAVPMRTIPAIPRMSRNSAFSRAFKAPSKSKIKYHCFSKTSRSNTIPEIKRRVKREKTKI